MKTENKKLKRINFIVLLCVAITAMTTLAVGQENPAEQTDIPADESMQIAAESYEFGAQSGTVQHFKLLLSTRT